MWLPVFLASYTTRRPLAVPSAGLVPTTAGGERLAAWPGSLAPAAARSRYGAVRGTDQSVGWLKAVPRVRSAQQCAGRLHLRRMHQALYQNNDCYRPGDSKTGCMKDAIEHCKSQYVVCKPRLEPWLDTQSTLRHQIPTLSRHYPDTPTLRHQCQSTLGPTLRHQCQASVKPS
jgi:hypothetical protein